MNKKTLTSVFAALAIVISFCSCEKHYKCQCTTYTTEPSSQSVSTTVVTTDKQFKNSCDAKDWCEVPTGEGQHNCVLLNK